MENIMIWDFYKVEKSFIWDFFNLKYFFFLKKDWVEILVVLLVKIIYGIWGVVLG